MIKLAIPVIVATVAILMIASQTAYSQNPQIQQGYTSLGSTAGDEGDPVSQVIFLNAAEELSFLLTVTGANFNSSDLEVSVSTDGTNFIVVDTISLETNTEFGRTYDANNFTNSTTTNVNVMNFPYVNLTTTDGISSEVEEITWTAR